MFILDTPARADKFVDIQVARGNDVRWETFGKTLLFWQPNPKGITSPHGALRNGVWGMETRVEVNSEGKMEVPTRCVKFAKRTPRN